MHWSPLYLSLVVSRSHVNLNTVTSTKYINSQTVYGTYVLPIRSRNMPTVPIELASELPFPLHVHTYICRDIDMRVRVCLYEQLIVQTNWLNSFVERGMGTKKVEWMNGTEMKSYQNRSCVCTSFVKELWRMCLHVRVRTAGSSGGWAVN